MGAEGQLKQEEREEGARKAPSFAMCARGGVEGVGGAYFSGVNDIYICPEEILQRKKFLIFF